jgi:hypothetical protein
MTVYVIAGVEVTDDSLVSDHAAYDPDARACRARSVTRLCVIDYTDAAGALSCPANG